MLSVVEYGQALVQSGVQLVPGGLMVAQLPFGSHPGGPKTLLFGAEQVGVDGACVVGLHEAFALVGGLGEGGLGLACLLGALFQDTVKMGDDQLAH
ncbi:MAG: hypothetical protein Q4D89_06015 [Arachnia propionica]|uniref:hypothetical protein n=1 Tax=Arachnia propionica TaxID=1750 RepID=UPI00270EEA80|nr:hypothetical protein [Arachnia propionica]